MLLKSICIFISSLQHCETLEYRYFYASNNEQLRKPPRLIPNQQDLQSHLNHSAVKYVLVSFGMFVL